MKKKTLTIVLVSILVIVPVFLFIIVSVSGINNAPPEEDPMATGAPIELDSDNPADSPPGMIKGERPKDTINSLTLDQSTFTDVLNKLGKPARIVEKEDEGYSIMYYRVPNTERYHKVYIKDDVVDYTIESITTENKIYKDFLSEKNNKKPSGAIYNLYDNNAGFDLFVFADDGIAFLTHEPSGSVAEIHNFTPVTYQNYFTTIAPKLTYN